MQKKTDDINEKENYMKVVFFIFRKTWNANLRSRNFFLLFNAREKFSFNLIDEENEEKR